MSQVARADTQIKNSCGLEPAVRNDIGQGLKRLIIQRNRGPDLMIVIAPYRSRSGERRGLSAYPTA